LRQYQSYWQLVPFTYRELPWQHDQLQTRLLQLSNQDIDLIGQNDELQQQVFGEFFPQRFALPNFFDELEVNQAPQLPFWLTNGIGGRKLEQVLAFIRHLPELKVALKTIEWCAGKGHLGRLYSYLNQAEVTSIEWQQQLCVEGMNLATQHELAQRFVQADVLSGNTKQLLDKEHQVLALHACGELHLQLLKDAVAKGVKYLHIAPCCYHLIKTPKYQPLSTVGQSLDLNLSKHDLKLSVQGQVTAGQRVSRLRNTEITWRLAYDSLRADITGQQKYQPLKSVAKHWFTGSFSEFCRWAAAQHQLQLPRQLNESYYLEAGEQRQLLAARIDAVRHVFRRPLEMWLLYDRLEFLNEHGYQTQLRQFCDYQITPRNALIQASLACDTGTNTV
jgi:hypothetical protein